MRFASCCSGIEGAGCAWEPLGWQHAFCAEIDPFASAVLAHRFPNVPNVGDFTKLEGWPDAVDVLVAGTPCQSFSVAGRRAGLDDPRGLLAFELLRLASRLRPRWLVFENVPGLLSSDEGRDFGAFLGALGDVGYGFAYRVLDAQWFGLAQRRARVFVVAHLGDWRGPVAVLLEPEGLRGDPSPSRTEGEGVAGALAASVGGSDENDAKDGRLIAPALRTNERNNSDAGAEARMLVPLCVDETSQAGCTLRDKAGSIRSNGPGSQAGGLLLAATLTQGAESQGKGGYAGRRREDDQNLVVGAPDGTVTALCARDAKSHKTGDGLVVGFHARQDPVHGDKSMPLEAKGGQAVMARSAVRRFTPRECEALQGFPPDWTLVPYRGKPAKDGPRYRAIGNAFPVPVLRWIGERIAMFEEGA